MSLEYGSGSLAVVLIDLYQTGPIEEDEPTTINYKEYIQSAAWKLKADAAKKRAGYRCQVCYGTDRLQAHHRTYIRLGNELLTDITVLCDKCHETISPKKDDKKCLTPLPF